MKYLPPLASRTVLLPLALVVGAVIGAGVTKSQVGRWIDDRWAIEAYQAANTAALLDMNKAGDAHSHARRQMAVALDSFASGASEAAVQRNAGMLRAISTYLAAKPSTGVSTTTQQLMTRFPPYTRSEAQQVKCTAAICQFAKEGSASEK
jgi:hypothetical protein